MCSFATSHRAVLSVRVFASLQCGLLDNSVHSSASNVVPDVQSNDATSPADGATEAEAD